MRKSFWPEADSADTPLHGWPKIFCETLDSEERRRQIAHARKALLCSTEEEKLFVTRGNNIGLVPSSAPGLLLSALRECGDTTCSCCRLNDFHDKQSRRRFCDYVVEYLADTFASEPLHYISLACGHLLTDAVILAGVLERGGKIGAITLVDLHYGVAYDAYVDALSQLARFFGPVPVAVYHSLEHMLESTRRNTHHVLIACDAGIAVTKGIRKAASQLLAPHGLAATLMNGGRFGSTTRAWVKIDRAPQDESDQPDGASTTPGIAELQVPREPGAAAPFPPHMAW